MIPPYSFVMAFKESQKKLISGSFPFLSDEPTSFLETFLRQDYPPKRSVFVFLGVGEFLIALTV
ncbi:MAG: hypothetical protein C0407_02905 [Desulfobacca sp.]|nr:hypothetical protein [Desulfobacca sp.]